MFFRNQFVDQGLQIYASAKLLEWNEWSAYALKDWKGVVKNKNLLYFRLLDPQMVDSVVVFSKYSIGVKSLQISV